MGAASLLSFANTAPFIFNPPTSPTSPIPPLLFSQVPTQRQAQTQLSSGNNNQITHRLPNPALRWRFLCSPPSSCENIAMASTSSSTAVDERERKRKRAAGGDSTASAGPGTEAQPSKWRTEREHEIYSSKLFEALRLVRGGSSSASTAPARGRAVREAADRALAVAARGRSRWSRAILASRRRRLQAAHRARLRAPATPPARHPSVAAAAQPQPGKAPALAKKAKVLGRLVPGCHKLPFPALLSEASDYIKALEMQVRAMTALAEVLASVSSSSASGSSSSPA
ncbi:transcription factor bHLH148 [Aegilops tauschii subsp. strangulata]|uniref:IBH1-like N-terminal domain-containing protein n=1 Tax=Aegilops tauschii subsp. strangulata TaxID=200361 RepID=A0A453I8A1_AEGTS|nr:transcription factor bHLH148 [Aegilops tauschii subsp. strangulata]